MFPTAAENRSSIKHSILRSTNCRRKETAAKRSSCCPTASIPHVRDIDREFARKAEGRRDADRPQTREQRDPEPGPEQIRRAGRDHLPARAADRRPVKICRPDAETGRYVSRPHASRLQIVADRTGGTLNAINRLEDMGRIYALVAADMRTLYTDRIPADQRKTRRQMARDQDRNVKDPELISRTRPGYFAK